ncbi:hypothetical protein P255_02523 [Acinetobacter brisouii CIP 110357]|uniref:Uncharacterized protein n=1 Tax=Acinetobacter brisouii CIP 110357 TaxID=1341683 RepID=V2UPF9_9GAMM|nr:hypothetical protein F954_02040 [Acinetobacter brisouii ANC 4119]ESK50540.1 hypothetical protein P255_02523 [Acinetobacter brisouii CIP 110357]
MKIWLKKYDRIFLSAGVLKVSLLLAIVLSGGHMRPDL